MNNAAKDIEKRLFELADPKYKEFHLRLLPGYRADAVIGVRTPPMRKLASEFAKRPDINDFISELPHRYYEENLVHFFMIALIKDFDKCITATETFLPYVDCWPVSDQSSPAVFKKNHEKILPFIRKWISSDHVYTARFGIRMLMNEFLGKDFRKEYPEIVASVTGEDYYLKMMVAWYFATALAKRYDETVVFLEHHRLDPWVHNKAIQKALESFRVTDEHKAYLRSLKVR